MRGSLQSITGILETCYCGFKSESSEVRKILRPLQPNACMQGRKSVAGLYQRSSLTSCTDSMALQQSRLLFGGYCKAKGISVLSGIAFYTPVPWTRLFIARVRVSYTQSAFAENGPWPLLAGVVSHFILAMIAIEMSSELGRYANIECVDTSELRIRDGYACQ